MTTSALKASLGVITGTSALKASLRVINGKQNNELNGQNSLVGIPLDYTSETLHTARLPVAIPEGRNPDNLCYIKGYKPM